MKKFWKYYMLFLIIGGWFVLSVTGFVHKDTLYRAYTVDAKTTPYFVLVFAGMKDGIYPWSKAEKPLWEQWEELAEQEDAQGNDRPVTDVGITENTNHVRPNYNIDSPVIHSPYAWNEIDSPFVSSRGFVAVDESYFSNAVFIGDSRTVGLGMYGKIEGATFYASDGMNVYNLWSEKFCEVNGKKVTLEEALSTNEFEKVYIQVGINEMGWGTADGFVAAYAQTVEKIKELQPKAVIFVQGIMRVTKEKSDSDTVYSNDRINARNEKLAELADRKRVFYIDMNEVLCDDEGHLKSEYTYDEFHLYASRYALWVEYLMAHGV